MYNPNRYRISDHKAALDFMTKYSFAAIVGKTKKAIEATHIPLEVEQINDQLYVYGHVPIKNIEQSELPLERVIAREMQKTQAQLYDNKA